MMNVQDVDDEITPTGGGAPQDGPHGQYEVLVDVSSVQGAIAELVPVKGFRWEHDDAQLIVELD